VRRIDIAGFKRTKLFPTQGCIVFESEHQTISQPLLLNGFY